MSSVPLSKRCSVCKKSFPLTREYFRRWSKGNDGFQARCKACTGVKVWAESIEEKLWSRVEKTDRCWLYHAGLTGNGYGQIVFKNQHWLAHRLSYVLRYGPIPNEICVLHECDVRNCVNPDHLFLGTNQDNSTDMVQKQRQLFGSRHHKAKLTNEQVLEVRRLFRTGSYSGCELARQFHVSSSTIYRIVQSRGWTHL